MSNAKEKFIALLKQDILQSDLADLDFGIYRILKYRRREIDSFLDAELPKRIVAALAGLPGKATEDEQGRVFHHLYTFFARYYDDGDFVTRPRRGRNAAYSVPYNGQDVHFWWATKGSHYVKSGERFSAYVWRDGPRAIRIVVTQADVEKDNVKGVKRYYMPAGVAEADGELRVTLAWRPLDAEEAKRFEKKPRGAQDDDDVPADDAPEGRTAQEKILNAWLDGEGAKKAKIPAGVDKALLKKHLARYVAGQTSDFFVHPQLGKFLAGELDWYLKNEFVEIWDRAEGDALARERGKLAVVRDIGGAIIAFLAAIEDVQAQLFEKRKFVLASDWLARVSALPQGKAAQAIIHEACANAEQVNEWLAWLGEKPLGKSAAAAKRGAQLLAAWPHLCIHTRHFDAAFKYRLLAVFDDIEAATGGTLIHSENYAALRTLEYAYKQRVKCIYIDPPYNTGKDDFLYNDAIGQHGTWATMLFGRLQSTRALMQSDAALFASIDHNERERLDYLLSEVFDAANRLGEIVWHNVTDNNPTQIATEHEYIECYGASVDAKTQPWKSTISVAKDALVSIGRELLSLHGDTQGLQDAYREWFKDNKHSLGRLDRYKYIDRGGVYTGSQSVHNPGKEGYRYDVIHPRTKKACKQPLMGYRFAKATMDELLKNEKILFGNDETKIIELKVYAHEFEDKRASVLVLDGRAGANELRSLFAGALAFKNPKPSGLIEELVPFVAGGRESVADYFAGSGTTGHAVINLNREDGGTRKFVLVEQGDYFDTVLLPRIAKVIACPDWKDGKPKDGVAMAGDGDHWSARSPALVQVLRLERYEDSLDALELPNEADARRAGQKSFADEPLRYVHEAAAGKASVTLNHSQLAHPFDVRIPQTANGARVLANVDLPATALLLLGLHPVRVREVMRKLPQARHSREGGNPVPLRYLFVEARPNGKPKELHLLFLRDCDDALVGEALRKSAESEMHWLDETVAREFDRKPGDYAQVWHNRDAVLSSPNAGSFDPEIIRRMLERAPQ
ncbi:MAG: site-specific DNA-methyltransferase [Proteobacteria bacterium]|nr:site-specific DNA-methyltransferase [Pseudomonadota bacterium]